MPAATFQLMRVYDYLEAPDPASAILLDRLWPRGIAKEKLAGVLWEKDATRLLHCGHGFMLTPKSATQSFAPALHSSCNPHWHNPP